MSDVDIPHFLRINLHQIFNERDSIIRRATIAKYMSVDCLFMDANAAHRGHAAIDEAIMDIHKTSQGFVFTELAPPMILNNDTAVKFGKLRWGYAPLGEAPKVVGEDVLAIENGKITKVLAFIESPAA